MLVVYGTMLCKDCIACCEAFDKAGVLYEFRDFAADILHLKEFLRLRDAEELFDSVKAAGSIGVPCIVTPEGIVSLDWESFL